jgi:hypothetical protein
MIHELLLSPGCTLAVNTMPILCAFGTPGPICSSMASPIVLRPPTGSVMVSTSQRLPAIVRHSMFRRIIVSPASPGTNAVFNSGFSHQEARV